MGPSLFSILLFLLVAVGSQFAEISQSAGPQQQNQGDQEDICFLWAFGRLTKGGQEHDFAPVKRDMIMKSGDRLGMFVELKKKCFVYVIHRSTEGKIKMLLPYDLKEFDAEIQTSKPYFIPRDDKLLELDEQVGLETFFLLASAQRLHSLRTLIKDYHFADGTKKTEFAEKLLSEIRELRWKYRTFKTFAERPRKLLGVSDCRMTPRSLPKVTSLQLLLRSPQKPSTQRASRSTISKKQDCQPVIIVRCL
jgi:hypothetical protein